MEYLEYRDTDKDGNILCPHTLSNIVFNEDGSTVEEKQKLFAPKQDPAFSGKFTAGEGTTADTLNFVIGKYNKTPAPVSSSDGDLFLIGNGTQTIASNAFRINAKGEVYGTGAYHSSGADMAEYFQWEDENAKGEDRRGLLVTLNGDKIKPAGTGDFILGVISAAASFVGDAQEDQWKEKFLTDVFGQVITKNGMAQINPNFDPDAEYIPRSQRKEWSVVSLKGKIVVRDDGTCKVNEYCNPLRDGIATHSEKTTPLRVMKRIDDQHIYVLQY